MKKLLIISILALIVGCSSSSSSSKTKKNCYDPNPKGEGHSTFGIPQVWSC